MQTVALSSICVSYSFSAIPFLVFCHVGVTKCYTPQRKSVLSDLIHTKLNEHQNILFFFNPGFSYPIIVRTRLAPVSCVLLVTFALEALEALEEKSKPILPYLLGLAHPKNRSSCRVKGLMGVKQRTVAFLILYSIILVC